MATATSEKLPPKLGLHGVDHTARPTWKLRETIEFYRDKLGLPLVHVISARGWGPSTHPDFVHFFFDSGNGSTIAFFYYLGSEEPDLLRGRAELAPLPEDHVFDATHTAWLVPDAGALMAWKGRLESMGLDVSAPTTHETIQSIYVRDPNGYFIEFTYKLRAIGDVDAEDGSLTLQAALLAEDEARAAGGQFRIDDVWRHKARLLQANAGAPAAGKARLFVPRVKEFEPLLDAARQRKGCRIVPLASHDAVESDGPLEFGRKELGMTPALWYGLATGGLDGIIEVFDRDRILIVPAPSREVEAA
ncbi:MAG TPA: VOC family protein [Ramlibacter sp.]|uniref:VOC family protein n=1 Tax=Ramlibacter sp. TaxID=1917967 RepID=UPI002C283B6E|nr:VOC family protein [Ramlibacter sp.]HVZ46497.1 VOC family protein [Ramlibacter sp.]